MSFTAEAVRAALVAEQNKAYGISLGLTKEQVSEVLTLWFEHYQKLPEPVSYAKIRESMVEYSYELQGLPFKEWRPGKAGLELR